MRVYGALMWSLGKVINTPEVVRVYLGSFWGKPLRNTENRSENVCADHSFICLLVDLEVRGFVLLSGDFLRWSLRTSSGTSRVFPETQRCVNSMTSSRELDWRR